MHLVGFLVWFSRPWGNVFKPLASKKWNLYKKETFHNIYGLTIVCVKFNNWKLTKSLFLFFVRIVLLYADKLFVQRTVLGVILKTIWHNGAFTKVLPSTTLHFVSRSHSYLPCEIGIYTVNLVGSIVHYPQKDERLLSKETAVPCQW